VDQAEEAMVFYTSTIRIHKKLEGSSSLAENEKNRCGEAAAGLRKPFTRYDQVKVK